MLLEIAAFNIASAIQAEGAGANRIELCENIAEGGTTASYGTWQLVRQKLHIPVFPIIRPRGGDFLYTPEEFDVMQHDINACRSLGFEGVVLGMLTIDGNIDVERTAQLVTLAGPMEVTFHRAFDRAGDPLQALEDVIRCGCKRILTSGHAPHAMDGKELIITLVQQAGDRITIMPGSGIRSNNIAALAADTGAVEIHSSARQFIPSNMQYINAQMKEMIENVSVDTDEIKAMASILSIME